MAGADIDADSLNGGAGLDTADYSGATAGVTVDLQDNISGGAATGDTFALVENVIGSNFADTLVARDGGTASGGGGNDNLGGAGGGTTTILVGGAGTDALSAASFGQELMQLELGNGVDAFTGIFRTTDSDRLLIDNSVFNIGLGVTANEIRNLQRARQRPTLPQPSSSTSRTRRSSTSTPTARERERPRFCWRRCSSWKVETLCWSPIST